MKLTKAQQEVYDYIKENPYCDIEDIANDLTKPMNSVSKILGKLDWDLELISKKDDWGTYRCTTQGASRCETGWVINE